MKEIENRADVEFLVDNFYKKVLNDDLIGHFFTEIVKLNWDTHIPIMYDFWESVLFFKASYKGNPMTKHIELHQKSPLNKTHFDRWLHLWEETIKNHFKGDKADLAYDRASQIANLMQFKIRQLD